MSLEMQPDEVAVQWRTKLKWLASLSLHPCPIKAGCMYCDTPDYPNSPETIYDWSFVDTAFCICLIDRSDRLAHSVEQFHRVGLCSKMLYYRPSRPAKEVIAQHKIKNKPGYGCWESHRTVMTLAREHFDSRLNVIFEDDVLFLPACKPKDIVRVRQHIFQDLGGSSGSSSVSSADASRTRPGKDWDVYYLGHFPVLLTRPQTTTGLWKTHSLLTHAYLQSTAFMERFVKMDYLLVNRERLDKGKHETPLDCWYFPRLQQYAHSPMLAVQAGFKSDNSGGSFIEWGVAFHGRHPMLMEVVFMRGAYLLLALAFAIALTVLVLVLLRQQRTKRDTALSRGAAAEHGDVDQLLESTAESSLLGDAPG